MALNIEPLDRNQTTAFREREALRQKVNEIIDAIGPVVDITWDETPTEGHGVGYVVTSGGIKGALNAEEMERIAGDGTLNTKINDEKTARSSADAALGTRIDNEETARSNADAALGTRIDNEETARSNADAALGTRIDNEETARSNADAALGTRIDGKQNTLTAGPGITISDNVISASGQVVEIDLTSDSLADFVAILMNNTAINDLFSACLSISFATADIAASIELTGCLRCYDSNPRRFIFQGQGRLNNLSTEEAYLLTSLTVRESGFIYYYIADNKSVSTTVQATDLESFGQKTTGFNVIFR